MDVFGILSQHHREIDQLLEQIQKEENTGTGQQNQLFPKLRRELELHTELEEQIFYPEVEKLAVTKALVADAHQHHAEVKHLLQEAARFSVRDRERSELIREVKLAVQEHVREEEDEIFPAARKRLEPHRIDDLTREVEAMKKKAGA